MDNIEQLETRGESYKRGYETGWKDGYAEALKYMQKELNLAALQKPIQYLVDKNGIHLIEEV